MTVTATRHRSAVSGALPAFAGVMIGVLWLAAVAWLIVPRGGVCMGVLPAPPGCGADARLLVAGISGLVLLAVGGLLVWGARRTARAWVAWLGVGVLAVAAMLSYYAVMYAQ